MDSGQGTLASSSSSVSNFRKRPPPAWVPCSGTKRKAHIADLGDNFDSDCRPSPAKQFAVDEEVATNILRDGFYYDPAIPPSANENQIPEEEVEMGEDFPASDCNEVYVKYPGEIASFHSSSHVSMSNSATLDEKECSDESVITPHSVHESQPVSKLFSSETKSSVMQSLSLILSNEIQETLTRKKQNEDFILPKSIMDQVTGSSTSMALVPWKPPMKMENLLPKESQANPKEKILKQKIRLLPQFRELVAEVATVPPSSTSNPTAFAPVLTTNLSSINRDQEFTNESHLCMPVDQEEETESMEMDTSI